MEIFALIWLVGWLCTSISCARINQLQSRPVGDTLTDATYSLLVWPVVIPLLIGDYKDLPSNSLNELEAPEDEAEEIADLIVALEKEHFPETDEVITEIQRELGFCMHEDVINYLFRDDDNHNIQLQVCRGCGTKMGNVHER